MSMSGTLSNGGVPKNPTFGTVIATSALKLNSGATFDLYNTADQTTNYERLRADWLSNVAQIYTVPGGTGSPRSLKIGYTSTAGGTTPIGYIQFGNGTGYVAVVGVASSAAGPLTQLAQYTQNAASGTQTAVSIAPTYNQSGTAGYTAFDINPTETATGSGTRLLQRWAVGGSEVGRFQSNSQFFATGINALGVLGFATAYGGSADVTLLRDAADTLALRRSTNAQVFRVYNTYTDGSNYERFQIVAGASNTDLVTFQAGTGSPRPLRMYTTGSQDLQFGTANLMRWTISTSGHLLAYADNTYDIGASGANRPRTGYFGTSVVTPYLAITDGIAAPGAGTGVARLYVDTADGDLKIIFSDGTIKTIVTDT